MNGSIDKYLTPTGKTHWRIRWDEPTANNGVRRRRSQAGIKTRSAAKVALHDIQRRTALGMTTQDDRDTLGDYLPRWLDGLCVKPTTLANYATCVNRYLIPTLGSVRLRDLQPEHLDGLYRKLEKDGKNNGVGLAPKTVRHVHTAIRKALQDAVKRGRLARNVADDAHPPTQRQSRSQNARTKAWTVEELGVFLSTIRGDHQEALWVLTATTGMRRGEVIGLRWDALDLDEGTANIFRTVTEVSGKVIMSESTKTDASQRRIALDKETIRVLRAHRKRQTSEQLAAGPNWQGDSSSIFTWPDGVPLSPSYVSRSFTKLVRRLGLPEIGFHGLRHTYATLAICTGIPAHIVSRRLGHANVAITMTIYAHAFPTDDRDAAERAAAFLFGT